MKILLWLTAIIFGLMMAGCGRYGELYLPAHKVEPVHPLHHPDAHENGHPAVGADQFVN